MLLTIGQNANDNVEVTHNESVNDATIAVLNATNVTVSYNKVINPKGSAIVLGAGVAQGEVSFNDLYGGPASGDGISISANQLNATLVTATSVTVGKSGRQRPPLKPAPSKPPGDSSRNPICRASRSRPRAAFHR